MLAGQGIGLPIPQAVTPSQPGVFPLPLNFAVHPNDNAFAIPAGGVMLVPAGWWYYDLGLYSQLVFRDPVIGGLLPVMGAATAMARTGLVNSDGANWYIINPKALPVSATVTAAGSGYTSPAGVVVTPTTNSTDSVWHAIIGGAITSITIGNDAKGNVGGTNFTLPPILVIGNPPPSQAGLTNLPATATVLGGVPALATCTVSAGAINAITMVVNPAAPGASASGAGYLGAPAVQIIANPFDPSIGSITLPALTAVVGGGGTVTAVVLDHAGVAGGIPTLTITGGGGSSGTATAAVGIATAASDTIVLQALGSWF